MLAKFGLRAYSIQWILLALDTHTDYIVDIANNDDNNYETLSKDEEIFIRRSDFWDEKNFYVKKEFSETRKSVFEGFDMITCRNVSIFRALDYILDTTRNNLAILYPKDSEKFVFLGEIAEKFELIWRGRHCSQQTKGNGR